STGLALGVRSSTITGPAGGEGRVPNRQRLHVGWGPHEGPSSGQPALQPRSCGSSFPCLVSNFRVEQGVAWTRILCAMWSPDRRRGPDHRQSSRETCSW
ncbi:unnamed protein product, partial [Pylaiella littoralis]